MHTYLRSAGISWHLNAVPRHHDTIWCTVWSVSTSPLHWCIPCDSRFTMVCLKNSITCIQGETIATNYSLPSNASTLPRPSLGKDQRTLGSFNWYLVFDLHADVFLLKIIGKGFICIRFRDDKNDCSRTVIFLEEGGKGGMNDSYKPRLGTSLSWPKTKNKQRNFGAFVIWRMNQSMEWKFSSSWRIGGCHKVLRHNFIMECCLYHMCDSL